MLHEVREEPHKRRDWLEIIAVMLKAARVDIQKTHIMHEASLSFAEITEYSSFLVSLGFLEASERNGRLIYKTTAKGKLYVMLYGEIKQRLRKNIKYSPQWPY